MLSKPLMKKICDSSGGYAAGLYRRCFSKTVYPPYVSEQFFRCCNFFSGLLNKKLVQAVAKSCGYAADTTMDTVGKKGIFRLISTFKAFTFSITGSRSFEAAQICQGGVSLEEVDSQFMQSLLCPGLFFAGELLDVDGKCGGYNLQWAWSSGHLAGTSAAQYCISQKGTHYDSN